MIPRTPRLPHPPRQHLADPEEPGIDFSLACADCGCTACSVDLDTIDDERAPSRAPAHRRRSAQTTRSRAGR
jgi:hypothetical protein